MRVDEQRWDAVSSEERSSKPRLIGSVKDLVVIYPQFG